MNVSEIKYLLFALAGDLFALELSQLAEVLEPQPLCPLPAVASYYRGAMNFHGVIVAVMDLADFLGLDGAIEAEKFIVLHESIGALAFQAERVIRIVPEDQAELCGENIRPFAKGTIMVPEGEAILLDAGAITNRATEMINSAATCA